MRGRRRLARTRTGGHDGDGRRGGNFCLTAFLSKQRKNRGEQWGRLGVCMGEGEAKRDVELRMERGGGPIGSAWGLRQVAHAGAQ
jgi:hypothetical protein